MNKLLKKVSLIFNMSDNESNSPTGKFVNGKECLMNKGIATQEMKGKWRKQLNYCLDEENLNKLNEWEQSLIDSLSIQFSKKDFLTFKQSNILRSIYNRITGGF